MPIYHRLGEFPAKRHVVFEKKDGGMHYEELIGNLGFAGISSLLYHRTRPAAVKSSRVVRDEKWRENPDHALRMRHFRLAGLPRHGTLSLARHPLLFNGDVKLSMALPAENDSALFRNADGDEVHYIARGCGTLHSLFGTMPVKEGDYVVIPRGILYRFDFEQPADAMILVIESVGYIRTPKRYRNAHGQLLEHAPFCERDLRRPTDLPIVEQGETPVLIKAQGRLNEVVLANHPFNVTGWDGYYYPWAFNIADFEPITGRVHQPPPVHQTFECEGFVVCSFVPRLYDYHPKAVPAPYHHSNVMTDEVLFYAKDKFMSRKGIEFASLTLHPDGLAHGPHPGTTEASIGKEKTDELAVMLDTFRSLKVAQPAVAVEDADYETSWL